MWGRLRAHRVHALVALTRGFRYLGTAPSPTPSSEHCCSSGPSSSTSWPTASRPGRTGSGSVASRWCSSAASPPPDPRRRGRGRRSSFGGGAGASRWGTGALFWGCSMRRGHDRPAAGRVFGTVGSVNLSVIARFNVLLGPPARRRADVQSAVWRIAGIKKKGTRIAAWGGIAVGIVLSASRYGGDAAGPVHARYLVGIAIGMLISRETGVRCGSSDRGTARRIDRWPTRWNLHRRRSRPAHAVRSARPSLRGASRSRRSRSSTRTGR